MRVGKPRSFAIGSVDIALMDDWSRERVACDYLDALAALGSTISIMS
jgi:hypothetical protein